jgi:hypothetical protein
MSKIFQIEVRTTVYFYGEDFPDSDELSRIVADEIDLENYDDSGESLSSADIKDLPDDVLDSYPYGKNGDRHTIREWLEHG